MPEPGAPGSETWTGAGDAWRTGGGTFVQTGSYDPASGTTVWGVGGPHPPFDAASRPGEALHTNGTLALDVATGAIR